MLISPGEVFLPSGVTLFHNSEFLPNSGLSKCDLKKRGRFFPTIIPQFPRFHWKLDTRTPLISSRSSIKNMEFPPNSFCCNTGRKFSYRFYVVPGEHTHGKMRPLNLLTHNSYFRFLKPLSTLLFVHFWLHKNQTIQIL